MVFKNDRIMKNLFCKIFSRVGTDMRHHVEPEDDFMRKEKGEILFFFML